MTEIGLVESNMDFGNPVGLSLEERKNALTLTIIVAIVSAALLALSIYGGYYACLDNARGLLLAFSTLGMPLAGIALLYSTIFSISLAEDVQDTHEGYTIITSRIGLEEGWEPNND